MYQPLRNIYEFVKQLEETDPDSFWGLRDEYTMYRSPSEKFVIQHWTNRSAWGYGRKDYFEEQMIDIDREDELEMARVFVHEVGQNLSPHDMMVLRSEIDKYLDQWNKERVALGYPVYEYEAT